MFIDRVRLIFEPEFKLRLEREVLLDAEDMELPGRRGGSNVASGASSSSVSESAA